MNVVQGHGGGGSVPVTYEQDNLLGKKIESRVSSHDKSLFFTGGFYFLVTNVTTTPTAQDGKCPTGVDKAVQRSSV
jgi:hypothetical protein